MRIILLPVLLIYSALQAQPFLDNLNNGLTGQFLTKGNNNPFGYTWVTVNAGTVGLGNVTNESKATMFTNPAFTGTPTGITAAHVGLGNVNNTSNATERAASAVLSSKTIATFNYAADAGSNDTYVISLSPSPGAYTTGMIVFFKANTVNTGAASINVNGLGVKTIVKRVSTTLANGDIPALSFKMLIYDGTQFVLLNPVVN